MAFGFGVPERVFAARPELRDEAYSLYAYETDAAADVLTSQGLRAAFGPPGRVEADVARALREPQVGGWYINWPLHLDARQPRERLARACQRRCSAQWINYPRNPHR